MHGHSGDLYSLCWHPTDPNVFATASDCSWLTVWDAERRVPVASANISMNARAICFSSAPVGSDDSKYHIAVGSSKGRMKVGKEQIRPKVAWNGITIDHMEPAGVKV